MKKLMLAIIPAITLSLLTACTKSTVKSSPVAHIDGLTHICIKEVANPRLPQFTQLLAENLKARGIHSEIKADTASNCPYVLAYSLKEQNGLIKTAKLRLSSQTESARENLGESAYWFRGKEEKARVATAGLKGQVDSLVNALFKHD